MVFMDKVVVYTNIEKGIKYYLSYIIIFCLVFFLFSPLIIYEFYNGTFIGKDIIYYINNSKIYLKRGNDEKVIS